LEET
jgi:hypothetical protein